MTNVPVLLVAFNRPESTAKVLARILEAEPREIYIAADGPRPSMNADIERCEKTRAILTSVPRTIKAHYLFQNHNLGCRVGPSTAFSWFFSNVESGIILEDDCLPDPSFFRFCEKALERYENESVVKIICGRNPFGRFPTKWDCVFSRYPSIWGWATWRRVWQDFDLDLKDWPSDQVAEDFRKWLSSRHAIWYWFQNFDQIKEGFDAWDYQLYFMLYKQRGLAAISATNLVTNIGFDSNATHTSNLRDIRQSLPVIPAPGDLTYPEVVTQDRRFDRKMVRLDYYNEDLTLVGKVKKVLRPLLRLVKNKDQA